MTLNREVFLTDPMTTTIPNEGVTKVLEPRTPKEWDVLRYELTHFVCEGEYERGLERILSTYLGHLGAAEQPAVWVSGFYGSGKSHFVRVLEYLWRDVIFPDGASARGLTNLPAEIDSLLKELTTAGKREGGLWSAAGTLGAGAGRSGRLAMLGILFRSAGLPEQYAPARFVIWLRHNGYYDAVKTSVERAGKDFSRELTNMYVSPVLANSLLEVYPDFAGSSSEARGLLKVQYPNREDVSDEELLVTMEDVLALQSSTPGKLPCTLLIFDELQQFLGDDATRALQVQTIVEACSARFGSRVVFVATGQAALTATPQLQKLQGRFTVRVTLSDTDVEKVVREVVLRKKDDQKPVLRKVLDGASGEIDRQLAGTRVGPRPTDANDLVPDYPLLPVRRRFWESVLRAVDTGGTTGQLRTQLRIVHEAARAVAERPVGTVVAGDFVFDQLKADMLQSAVLLRDLEVAITDQARQGPEGVLRARLCALIFLIGKLPTEGPAATGIRATADALADLLVENLSADGARLRQRIPVLLDQLVQSGMVMLVGDEYRLQTRESAEWESDFYNRRARIQADDARIANDRTDELKKALGDMLRGMTFTQGVNRTPRKYELYFGADLPTTDSSSVPVWIRDEWSASEKTVREDAQREGMESPVVFVFVPKQNVDALRTALAMQAAARECLDARPRSQTPEGMEARTAMEARLRMDQARVRTFVTSLANGAHVYQGGGIEVSEASLAAAVRTAIESGLARLFPEFKMTDVPGWGKVVEHASQGASDALSSVQHTGDADKHPACKKVREYVGSSGKRGNDVRRQFMGPPFGWPQDAVDGILLALLAGGFLRASRSGQPVGAKGMIQSQIGAIDFYSEGVTISAVQRIAVRRILTSLGQTVSPGAELEAIPGALSGLRELAAAAGGEPPLPSRPPTDAITALEMLSGNEQVLAVFERQEALLVSHRIWSKLRDLAVERLPRWRTLQQLMNYAASLPAAQDVAGQVAAIAGERSLLADPDPLPPLLTQVGDALRAALQEARSRYAGALDKGVTGLGQTPAWQRLTPAQRQGILSANELIPAPELAVGTEAELLGALAANSLGDWENRIAAVASRIEKAREQAARLLEPETVRVQVPPATIRSEAELDDYLGRLRAEIKRHLDDGHPVIL